MQIEIWSDLVCPWCYIGKRRFDRALSEFEHAGAVTVVWRAFELDPAAPTESDASVAEILARKYGGGLQRANELIRHVTEVAAEEGLEYRLDIAARANTFDAHRLTKLAAERSLQQAMVERAMRAYFTEGRAIGDPSTLAALAAEVGLDAQEVREMLASDGYVDAVRADERTAARLGVQAVPCIVFDRRTGLQGAQPAHVMLRAMREAYEWGAKSGHPARAEPTGSG